MPKQSNIAFVDGQNLHLGTTQRGWKVHHGKFRTYLKEKYGVREAYYHLGYMSEEEKDLYTALKEAGFVVLFREHSAGLKGAKKGNVDTDIVFEVMKALIERKDFESVVLVSGDGDFKKLVDYLITKKRLKKILFPNRQFASSLYKDLAPMYYDSLETPAIRAKISFGQKKKRRTKKKGSP